MGVVNFFFVVDSSIRTHIILGSPSKLSTVFSSDLRRTVTPWNFLSKLTYPVESTPLPESFVHHRP